MVQQRAFSDIHSLCNLEDEPARKRQKKTQRLDLEAAQGAEPLDVGASRRAPMTQEQKRVAHAAHQKAYRERNRERLNRQAAERMARNRALLRSGQERPPPRKGGRPKKKADTQNTSSGEVAISRQDEQTGQPASPKSDLIPAAPYSGPVVTVFTSGVQTPKQKVSTEIQASTITDSKSVQTSPPSISLDSFGVGVSPPNFTGNNDSLVDGLVELYGAGPLTHVLERVLRHIRRFLHKGRDLWFGNYSNTYSFISGVISECNEMRFYEQKYRVDEDDRNFHVRPLHDWLAYYAAYGQDLIRQIIPFFSIGPHTQPDEAKRVIFHTRLLKLLFRIQEIVGLVIGRVAVARHYLERLDSGIRPSTQTGYRDLWQTLRDWWGFPDDDGSDEFGGLL